MTSWHLAQFNIARMVAPLESEQLAGFVAGLEPLNALADRSPGFVWRLQTDEGTATSIRPYEDDDLMIINMSVWESIEALSAFTYNSDHRNALRQRRQWFERLSELYLVLWWILAGTLPSVDEGKAKLELLRTHGPTVDAFTVRSPFAPPATAP